MTDATDVTDVTDFAGYRAGTREYRRVSLSLFVSGLATFALLYSTQSLLPLLADDFRVTAADAAWTVSITTLTLGIALMVAGAASEVIGRVKLMRWSLVGSSVVAVLTGLAPTWPTLLALRGVEGVLLAGLPAVAMAYLAEETHVDSQPRAAGLYIAGTALGGMCGRLVSGAVADAFSWRAALVALGILGLACGATLFAVLPASRGFRAAPASLGHMFGSTVAILRDPAMGCLFVIAATSMGAFVGLFNAVGFRLAAAPYLLPVGVASLVFSVYALGSVSSATAGSAVGRHGQRAVTPVALLVMLAGVLLTLVSPVWLVVAGLATLTSGFFATHGTASGWVAARAGAAGAAVGQASSMYLLAYYLGSSAFGWLASTAWTHGGWPWVVALTGGLVVIALGAALTLRRIPSLREDRRPEAGIVGY